MRKLVRFALLPGWTVLLILCAWAGSVSAVAIDWVTVGDPGNACDTQSQGCFGSVASTYRISKYEVTNAQYAEFLNAKAAADPLGLYNTNMSSSSHGGLTRSGVSGSYTYAVKAGMADKPVNYVSFYDSLRFSNWLNNGQASGDTETGAYTLLGGTASPSNGLTVTRNAGADIFLTSENEWYKAAYHSAGGVYFDYPAASDTPIGCVVPGSDTGNSANCYPAVVTVTDVGAYALSDSPYGTYDQGGNVWEWNEEIIYGSIRGLRGGDFYNDPYNLAASHRYGRSPTNEYSAVAFRVASIPEPATGLLVMTGLLGLAGWRRRDI